MGSQYACIYSRERLAAAADPTNLSKSRPPDSTLNPGLGHLAVLVQPYGSPTFRFMCATVTALVGSRMGGPTTWHLQRLMQGGALPVMESIMPPSPQPRRSGRGSPLLSSWLALSPIIPQIENNNQR